MRPYDIILKKRNGEELTKDEIYYMVHGFTKGEIPDYQMSAFLMAVYFRGMSERETADLTLAMVDSGAKVDLSSISGIKVDKHSTGGVGDKTTLVLAPLVSSCGVKIAKLSGRGLGHTGGTLDKLESISGFNVKLSMEQFIKNVETIGIAVAGQTGELVPADGKMYALRDVTATVDSIPLIASSIMSKKIAGGADAIVLDVKTGSGAFMKSLDESIKLAECMVNIGKMLGRRTVAVISEMDEPLGYAVGNSLEVMEAVETLSGKGPADLKELCLTLGSYMLILAGRVDTKEEAINLLEESIKSGKAISKFKEMVELQNGDVEVIENPEKLPKAKFLYELRSEEEGCINKINALSVGNAAMVLGAGRIRKDSAIDLSVGIVLKKKVGDKVNKNEILADVYYNDPSKLEEALKILKDAYKITDNAVLGKKLVKHIVE